MRNREMLGLVAVATAAVIFCLPRPPLGRMPVRAKVTTALGRNYPSSSRAESGQRAGEAKAREGGGLPARLRTVPTGTFCWDLCRANMASGTAAPARRCSTTDGVESITTWSMRRST